MMDLRTRLACWYSLFFASILLVVTLMSYAMHARGHYDDLDRALVSSATHTASEITILTGPWNVSDGVDQFRITTRVYTLAGHLLAATSSAPATTARDPRTVLAHPGGPAFDMVAGLAPPIAPIAQPAGSAFTTIAEQGARWRLFVLPFHRTASVSGYVETTLPLVQVDTSMQGFRLMLLGLSLIGLLIAFIGSRMLAGRALLPLTDVITTAQEIEQDRDLARRLALPVHHDDLWHLATTFNGMLSSLDHLHQTQQRFVSDASHELRAPLTAIQANLNLLQRFPDMSAFDRAEAITEAGHEAERLSQLVGDLLALARADAGMQLKQDRIELDAVVLDALNTTHHLARGQHISLDPFEPVCVCGDGDRLKQVLIILLDNAIKYTPAPGQIRIGLRRLAQAAEIQVQDTGMGIPAEALPHVFERFYRADPARGRDPGGTGLGLAIAHWIVAQHHGMIQLESQVGSGTTVTISFPSERPGE